MVENRIEPFDKRRHRRSDFQCGVPALDDFLRTFVTQYEKRRLGKTFVAVPSDDALRVIGYYTLAAGAVAFAHLPIEVARKLPRHPVPVILLARLAVDHWGPRKEVSAVKTGVCFQQDLRGLFRIGTKS